MLASLPRGVKSDSNDNGWWKMVSFSESGVREPRTATASET